MWRGGGVERVEANVEWEEMSKRKERGESEAEVNFEEQVKEGENEGLNWCNRG